MCPFLSSSVDLCEPALLSHIVATPGGATCVATYGEQILIYGIIDIMRSGIL